MIILTSHQLNQHKTIPKVLYPDQIVYGSGLLPKLSKICQSSSSTNFVNSCTAKFYKQIVWEIRMLSSNIDNKGVNKLKSLKKAIT